MGKVRGGGEERNNKSGREGSLVEQSHGSEGGQGPAGVGMGGGALSLPDSPSYQPRCQEIHIPAERPIGPDWVSGPPGPAHPTLR